MASAAREVAGMRVANTMRMRLARSFGLVPSLILALGLIACATDGANDGSDVDEGATTITPQGADSPGSLKVVLPNGATNVADAKFDVDSKNEWRPLGTVVSAIAVGAHAVEVSTSSDDFSVRSRTAANVTTGNGTTVVTSAISPSIAGAPRTLGLDVPTADLQVDSGIAVGRMRVGFADGTHALAVAGTEIAFRYGLGGMDGARFTLSPGDVKKLDIWDVSQRRRVEVRAPAARELPDGQCGPMAATWRVSTGGTYATLPLATGTAIELGIASWHGNASYVLSHSEISGGHELPMGAVGAAPAVFALGRIDVNDVQLSGGATVKGNYDIYAMDAQGHGTSILKCKLPTGTGIDLPVGKYRVITHYETVEAGTKQDVADVDVN